jgi:hypothetical protein
VSVVEAGPAPTPLVRFEDLSDLYLGRCQVDTPHSTVQLVWDLVAQRRSDFGDVIDFGAGDGRFCPPNGFNSYLGFEIDPSRAAGVTLAVGAQLITSCAFESVPEYADIAVGNPPYVRNQDLPAGWRSRASSCPSAELRAMAWLHSWFLPSGSRGRLQPRYAISWS